MAYGIVINLDYDSHSQEVCRLIWAEIKERMFAAGFHRDGRTFVINLPEREACELARTTVESIEAHLDDNDRHLHIYIKEFYGFPLETRTNLLVPAASTIEVKESG